MNKEKNQAKLKNQASQEEQAKLEEQVDVLPDELDPSSYVGPYLFPNNNRRRIPGALYLFLGFIFTVTWIISLYSDTPLINYGFLAGGLGLIGIGAHHIITGWNLKIDEKEAFLIAVAAVQFPVGHASAQMGWRGWASLPTWRVLVYSSEPQPRQRGLVLIDGGSGDVLECLVHDNPEEWTEEMQRELDV